MSGGSHYKGSHMPRSVVSPSVVNRSISTAPGITRCSSLTDSTDRLSGVIPDTSIILLLQRQIEDIQVRGQRQQGELNEVTAKVQTLQEDVTERHSTLPKPHEAFHPALSKWMQTVQEQHQRIIEETFRHQEERVSEALRAVVATTVKEKHGNTPPIASLDDRIRVLGRDCAAASSRLDGLIAQMEKHSEQLEALHTHKDKSTSMMSSLWDEHHKQWRELQSVTDWHRSHWESGNVDKCHKKQDVALEAQLQDLAVELRKLQQEQVSRSDAKNTSPGQSIAGELCAKLGAMEDMPAVLQELHSERGRVADMLEGVRQEKLEVIAMMHSFQMDKHEALKELEQIWQSARTELANCAAHSRKVSSSPTTTATSVQSPMAAAPRQGDLQHSSTARNASPISPARGNRTVLQMVSSKQPLRL
eukprot:CAMPEP_0194487902 /NCGR_PEP_ID=MMETSP0253-20130528/8036_1 /TAXON_ID=2966 /ORGANISM="Noctiluca scintillans" /LENGTH=417 /DNA_ID=CAMNT_0039328207 /DNA_START=65 /DNA_END=1318 /DNA_ORIENTATION=-